MTQPVVRGYNMPGGRWHLVTARFTSEGAGADAYQLVMRRIPRGDLGIYRHGPPGQVGIFISAVSLTRAEVLRVARLLGKRGGADETVPRELAESMFIRRARMVAEHAAAGGAPGRAKIRHAGRGAVLYPDGTMREPGGQG